MLSEGLNFHKPPMRVQSNVQSRVYMYARWLYPNILVTRLVHLGA